MAARADRHALYEQAVQEVEFEREFISDTFRRMRGRKARLLREDFCGTARLCCEWVAGNAKNRAIGVDIDNEVLEWGREHNLGGLDDEARARISLIEDDVLRVQTEQPDIIVAMNFSYQLFKTRELLKRYFQSAREALVDDGVLFIDAFGGYDAYRETREKRKLKGFTYIWDQEHYNPITGEMTCHIHFVFKDKTRMDRAFSYEWRLWTLPELRELLAESGFSKVDVHWEGTDEETGEGNSEYTPSLQGDADPSWVCYVTAQK